ncbi:hypothetical protein [Colwellia piezophila]|uniref:hypothetical protein n=1 Tax=Colwellia piezophila TaxID=211668 RepID=UPI00035D50E7|nr:hypothetical protein [Colwellia piezophila]
MRWNSLCFVSLFVGATAFAEIPNTLISIQSVELNNKDKPIMRTYQERWNVYQIINEKTQKIKSINQNGKAKAIYLEPGSYCLKSFNLSDSDKVNILNPHCFKVVVNVISNTGTFVIGTRVGNDKGSASRFALLVDMKDNYSELESILAVTNSVPAVIYKSEAN